MNNEMFPPAITFDKRNCIRIYKKTLRMLGRPKYIRLLINPDESTLVVQPTSQTRGDYHRVDWRQLDSSNSCELYSKFLSDKLREVCVDWDENGSYRIYGKYYKRENIAFFKLNDAVQISTSEEETYE